MIKDLGFDSTHLVEPIAKVGGILLLWKSDRIKIHILGDNYQGVHAFVEVSTFETSFILKVIYASLKFHLCKQLWNGLGNFATNFSHPWLLLGYFN